MSGYPSLLVPVGHVEPVPRRLRAYKDGRLVFDTLDAVYVWEIQPYPAYHVPLRDVDETLLGDARVGDDGLVRFEWSALDAWFEEDEEVFVHPRSPYARVDAVRSTRTVRVGLDGVVLAVSSSPVMVFETGLPTRYYLNRTDVRFEHLTPSSTVTSCPYKGRTTAYWSVGENADIAWSYDFPTAPLLPVAGLVCFYNEKVDISIDGVDQERPVTHFS